jgi:MoxR-like ATPase
LSWYKRASEVRLATAASTPDAGIARSVGTALIEALDSVLKGKRNQVVSVVTTLLAGGHLLLEDVPGVGKTKLARSVARAIGGTFSRVQATPDLLPQDLTGSNIYDRSKNSFEFHPGPIFANVVLVDELNRTTPRTQSALLEAMEERQVSVEGTTYKLPQPFFLIATQNPIEQHGTYPLPEGQLDRFMCAIQLGYPSVHHELEMLMAGADGSLKDVTQPVVDPASVLAAQRETKAVYVARPVLEYVLAIVSASRRIPGVLLGASPRAGLALVAMAQARAALAGRYYVLPDDVKALAPSVLRHRIIFAGSGQSDHQAGDALVRKILESTPVAVAGEEHYRPR